MDEDWMDTLTRIGRMKSVEDLILPVSDLLVKSYSDRSDSLELLPLDATLRSRFLPVYYAAVLVKSELEKRGYDGKISVLPYEVNGKPSVIVDLDDL